MLQLHKIEFRKNAASFPRPLIPREIIADVTNATHLLEHANEQAGELMRKAEEKSRVLQKNAAVEIWQRADDQFKRWEQEREQILANLEHHATLVINQAIKCIFDETVEPQRMTALIRQLLAIQIPQVSATLLCCPSEFEEVKQFLESHGSTLWKIQPDIIIPPQTLTLRTDEGDFLIHWDSMLKLFL